jgi:acyl-CoA reductase-like NAD-dependent aldehyde dehydrogenase
MSNAAERQDFVQSHTIVSTNPARNYEVLGEVAVSTLEEIQAKVAAARKAQPAWQKMGLEKRLNYLQKIPTLFTEQLEDLAKLTSQEMGMPITQSQKTVDRACDYMHWSLNNAGKYLNPAVSYETEEEINEIHREPYGVAACISPWNFPASNFVWACFQALIAGNTVVFKNSEEVQLFAQKIEAVFNQAGLPDGVFNVVYGDGDAAQALVQADIDFICFTGSSRVGQILYKQAAEKFIPAVLEMGGSDPAIVFADADLEKTIPALYAGRYSNCGQVCCALKRLIVHEDLHDVVVEQLKAALSEKKVGDSLDESTDIGPLATKRQLETLKPQVQDALDKGAKLICGGKEPSDLVGAYYEPTIITDITDDMKLWQEEVFGPVLAVGTFKTYEEAIQLANDTLYGLGSGVYTEDKSLAMRAAKDIKAGMVKINQTAYSRPENPFGGYKLSGLGRENGSFGFDDVTQVKVIAREK